MTQLTQDPVPQPICPRCQRADSVRQVSRLLAQGTDATALMAVHAAPTGIAVRADALDKRLHFAGDLASREIGAMPAGCTVALGAAIPVAVFGAGPLLALLLSQWGYPHAVSLPIGGIVLLAGFMGILNMVQRLPGFVRKAQEDRDAYLEARSKDQRASFLWQNELHYCFRDDCVFLPGRADCVPPEHMHVLLYA